MIKKSENLFERYIDKAVLGVVGILSLWFLWAFVLGNPYSTEIDGRKIGPGQIDEYIREQGVEQLLSKLEEPPKPKVYDDSKKKSPHFAKMVKCSINHIDENVCLPVPGYGGSVAIDSRIYTLPEIGELGDVAIEHYRSVVHKPSEPVGLDNPYSSVRTDFGDIDLITVQASFDVSGLYRNFEQSFSGRLVRRDWQDKTLAKPVYAKVDLQRRRKLGDDRFGEWTQVGRTEVDELKTMLEKIPEKIDDKHTTNLLMVKFDEFYIRRGILQPSTYEFASSNDDWLAPTFHKEYEKLVKEEQDRLRKDQQFERGVSDPFFGGVGGIGGRMGAYGGRGAVGSRMDLGGRGQRATGMETRGGRSQALQGRERTGVGGRGMDRRRSTTRGRTSSPYGTIKPDDERSREKKKERTASDVYEDFRKVFITEEKDLDKMREPLIFWAHDDTVVPGESYQYRIRLGVFNPIAGRDWFKENQRDYKDKPILWSEYSKETEVVDIPLMMHFFPLDVVAKEEKVVNIKVAKFHNGKWRSEDFQVRPGETIGKVVERKPAEGELLSGSYLGGKTDEEGNKVEVIDFGTGALLVDVVQTNDWSGVNRLQQRDYSDVLYSKDEEDAGIEHLAVKKRNWPDRLQKEFAMVNAAESEIVQLRGRSQGGFYQPGSSFEGIRPGGMPRGGMEMMMRMSPFGGRMPSRQGR